MPNREIKFRAWDGNKMWFPCDENDLLLLIGDSGYFEVQDHGKGTTALDVFNSADNAKAVLMQFTGRLDLFEGDILTYDRAKNDRDWSMGGKKHFPIEWDEKLAAFVVVYDREYKKPYLLSETLNQHNIKYKKAGNIYEHPHLIQSTQ